MNHNAPDFAIPFEQVGGLALENIWADPRFKDFCRRPFMAPRELRPNSLLFVGINPSYTEADLAIRYYDPHQGNHPYFRHFKEIAADVGQPWSHLDLLYYRETNQQLLDDLLKQQNGLDFVWEQLQLFPKLLTASQPVAVVVCNARARVLLGVDQRDGHDEWLDLFFHWHDGKWDDEIGTYRHQGIPFFFTSMLSGQRALDKGSRQRLIWQVRRATAKS